VRTNTFSLIKNRYLIKKINQNLLKNVLFFNSNNRLEVRRSVIIHHTSQRLLCFCAEISLSYSAIFVVHCARLVLSTGAGYPRYGTIQYSHYY